MHLIHFKKINPNARLPEYQSSGASGMDLRACIDESLWLSPMERKLIPTGLAIYLPEGLEAQVRPRSGLAARQGLTVLNSPGTVDSDYRGEILVLLVNLGSEAVEIKSQDRVAQLVIAPVVRPEIKLWAGELPSSTRGSGGFGHSGIS